MFFFVFHLNNLISSLENDIVEKFYGRFLKDIDLEIKQLMNAVKIFLKFDLKNKSLIIIYYKSVV